jgi:hypothetical protein
MLKYLTDVILLVVMGSVPYLFSRLRFQNSRSKQAMYELARHTPGIPEHRV